MTRCPLCNVPGAVLAPAVMNAGGVAALHLVTEQVCANGEACAQHMNAQRNGHRLKQRNEQEAGPLKLVNSSVPE